MLCDFDFRILKSFLKLKIYVHILIYMYAHTHSLTHIYMCINNVTLKVHPETQKLIRNTADYILSFEKQEKGLNVVL